MEPLSRTSPLIMPPGELEVVPVQYEPNILSFQTELSSGLKRVGYCTGHFGLFSSRLQPEATAMR